MLTKEEVFDILVSNPNWGKDWLLSEGAYCDMGYALHYMGVPDESLNENADELTGYGEHVSTDAFETVANLTGISEEVWSDIVGINDAAIDWNHHVAGLRCLLIDGLPFSECVIVARGENNE